MTTMFTYADGDVAELRRALSEERFGRYLAAAGDERRALRLHVWNTAVAASFYGPVQVCEVALRNAVHATLSAAYGQWWLRDDSLLRGDELRMARDAEQLVAQRGKEVVPGRVVAELGFGFWVGLFAKAYDEALWRTQLYRAFRPRPDRRELHDDLDRLRTLRNRIAHHEPISIATWSRTSSASSRSSGRCRRSSPTGWRTTVASTRSQAPRTPRSPASEQHPCEFWCRNCAPGCAVL